jgi:hypothetical protein
MTKGARCVSAILWCVAFSVCALPVAAKAAEVAPQLRAVLTRSAPEEKIPVIATLSRSEELVAQARSFGRKHRDSLVRELKERSRQGRAELDVFLQEQGIEDATELWLINGMALEADSETLAALSEHPAVEALFVDETRALSPTPRLVGYGPQRRGGGGCGARFRRRPGAPGPWPKLARPGRRRLV